MDLYKITTIFETLYSHADVPVEWYVTNREQPVYPYWQTIENYLSDGSFRMQEDVVNEYFTELEAIDLQRYLDYIYSSSRTTITEVNLPVTKDMQSLRSRPYYRGEGMLVLLEHLPLLKPGSDINPPTISVSGYYKLPQREKVGSRHGYL